MRAREAAMAFLDGADVDLAALPIAVPDISPWDRLVLDGVRTIRRGSTASYGEIARRIGRPGAARAVGGAVGRNPVSILVPCHRVIAADGSLGGYGAAAWGGVEAALDLKAALLALEGVTVTRRR
jgi:methylated-DNA-[protein]-cysteine S-methyltransferase